MQRDDCAIFGPAGHLLGGGLFALPISPPKIFLAESLTFYL